MRSGLQDLHGSLVHVCLSFFVIPQFEGRELGVESPEFGTSTNAGQALFNHLLCIVLWQVIGQGQNCLVLHRKTG